MTRLVPVTVLVVMLAASRIAAADDTGMLPGGGKIVFEHLQVVKDGKYVETEENSNDRLRYFNLAHCNCAKLGAGEETKVRYTVRATAQTATGQAVSFWVGVSCATDANRSGTAPMCKEVDSVKDIDTDLYPGGSDRDFNLFDVVNGKLHEGEACQQLETAIPIYALFSSTGSKDTFDYTTSQNVGAVYNETGGNSIDTRPPPLPTAIKAAASESGITLSWTPPTSNGTDVYAYQALCATVEDKPGRTAEQDPAYVTTASLCAPADKAKDPDLTESSIASGAGPDDVAVGAPTGTFGALDKSFVCGHTDSGTANSMKISGLANGTPYKVILLSIDLYGNYTGTYLNNTITPIPSTDFWEDLQGRGSDVEGGLCLLAETYGDDSSLTSMLRSFRDDTLGDSAIGRGLGRAYYATLGKLGFLVHGSGIARVIAAVVLAPLVAIALLWHWLTLPGLLGLIALGWIMRRRRWRLPRLAYAAPAVVVIAMMPQRAHAGGYQPYWENGDLPSENNDTPPDDPSLVKWHVGVRVGPYIPDVDKRFAAKPGPFEQMFGGYHMLVMLDVDRVIWSGYGQVAVGLSAGYWQKRARAWQLGSSPDDPMRPRASDENKFRMVPTALTLSYRFTVLDDEYGIPVVPYVRGGLSYYLWWISTANGNLAVACKDGSDTAGCDQTKALGGTLGVQGSIGLSIRAERIDASTANSMRQSGIQHAGIYGELSIGKVDGFGSESKLSVGDKTWFAGVDFEF